MPAKEQITEGRKAVEVYRTAHAKLYEKGWNKDIPDAHTPLLEKLKTDLRSQGFDGLDSFTTASSQLNEIEKGSWK